MAAKPWDRMVAENLRLRESLTKCRDALQTIASCHACKGGITLGFAVHCIDCTADVDAKEDEVDLDEVVQGAWEAANVALGAQPENKKRR